MRPIDLVNRLNRDTPALTIDGVRFHHHPDCVEIQGDDFRTALTVIIDGIKDGNHLVGKGLDEYWKSAKVTIRADGRKIIGSHNHGDIIADPATNAITLIKYPVSIGRILKQSALVYVL